MVRRLRYPAAGTPGGTLIHLETLGRLGRARADRLIAASRALLASSCVLALVAAPSGPTPSPLAAALVAYWLYALVLALALRRPRELGAATVVTAHALDLAVFSAFMWLAPGSSIPFFLLFVFSVLSGGVFWGARGTLPAAAVGVAAVAVTTVLTTPLFPPTWAELGSAAVRLSSLVIAAVLVRFVVRHEEEVRVSLARLAAWPAQPEPSASDAPGGMLRAATEVLGASLAVMVWDDPREPWLYVATLERGSVLTERRPPEQPALRVAAALDDRDFFCVDPAAASPRVVSIDGEIERCDFRPLGADLERLFAGRTVLGVRLRGESLHGWLLIAPDQPAAADDLLIARVVAQRVAAGIDQHSLVREQRAGVAREERLRIARDLHDGTLQTLSAAALHLEIAARTLPEESVTATDALREVQTMLRAEQRDIRLVIQELDPGRAQEESEQPSVVARLAVLVERIEREWDLHVALSIEEPVAAGLERLGRNLDQLIREALINVARHAHATSATVSISGGVRGVMITVCDDGAGFSFRGRFSHEALLAGRLGPLSLKQRVIEMGGKLSIESTPSGSTVAIELPAAVEVLA